MSLDVNALVDWAKVKAYLALDDSKQTYMEPLINAVCAQANHKTLRLLKARGYTLILDGAGSDTLLLPQYPVNFITKLYSDTGRVFGADKEILSSDYALYKESGIIKLYSKKFASKIRTVKAEFNAGLGQVTEMTITLATFLTDGVITINDLDFTAHGTVTTPANREFSISGDDTADAGELVTCINDATYGVPGITATSSIGVVTLVSTDPDETVITVSSVPDNATCLKATIKEVVPEDLQLAVLEILSWNIARFASGGQAIGVRSRTADGVDTGMEITIPLNAQRTLEFYHRTEG